MQSFTVNGMTCGHCVRAITAAVARRDAAAAVEINLESGRVDIDSRLPRGELARVITEEGYEVASA